MSSGVQRDQQDLRVETGGAAQIDVRNLSKQFEMDDGVEHVFSDISFTVEPGSFVTIIGRSGSGKSTLLNIISGILEPDQGQVEFSSPDGSEVDLGHVFQSPRLLPWNTSLENVELVHENDDDYTDEVGKQYLDLVGLSDQYDKYPAELSGGQRQRVGIARALSIDPEILLMDEPFSNLDEITAENLREELIEIWQRVGKTIVFVTHDITEAIELSDRVLMLGNGEIYGDIQIDLERPRSIESEEFLRTRAEAVELFHTVDDL